MTNGMAELTYTMDIAVQYSTPESVELLTYGVWRTAVPLIFSKYR